MNVNLQLQLHDKSVLRRFVFNFERLTMGGLGEHFDLIALTKNEKLLKFPHGK